MQKGAGILEPIIILAVVLFVMATVPKESDSKGVFSTSFSSLATNQSSGGNKQISIDTGNASYSYQSYEEYIAISNWGSKPVDLSYWQLKNGKDRRVYDNGGQLQRFSSDMVTLPPLILGPNERAVLTTGKPSVQNPYPIPNVFKENICTGYLEALPDYAFTPSLQYSCPSPSKEPGIENLDRECREFVGRISSCETPVFQAKDQDKETCTTCVKGVRLTSTCAAYVKEHFSYEGCLAYHSRDKEFNSQRTWRVFLGRGWEMWGDKYETIELFDRFGNLVSYINY